MSLSASDILPLLQEIGGLVLHALDTLPLPILIVFFLACLALLNWPVPSSPLLPTSSPASPFAHDKERLSPLISSYPSRFAPLPSTSSGSPVFVPALDPSGRPHYIAVSPDAQATASASSASSGTASPPRLSHSGASRRGSKQNWYRGGMLGVVPEESDKTAV